MSATALLTYGEGLKELTEIYHNFTGEPVDFAAIAHDKRLNVEQEALGSDVNRLASLFVAICENNRDRRDYTRAEIRRALREVAAGFSVYRTYVAPDRDQITEEDRAEIDHAVAEAKKHRTDLDPALIDFIGDVLALRARGGLETEFLLRFQQFTSPVMAKGVEDTALYCYNRMIGLNEVGSAPDREGLSLREFHDRCAQRQATHPYTMNTLTTHDTKRCEDVRARLAVLTEIPTRWKSALGRWARMNAQFKSGGFPDRNTEYFLYQTLIGAWPISAEPVDGLYGEGHPRSQAADELDTAEQGIRRRAAKIHRADSGGAGIHRGAGKFRRPRSLSRGASTAWRKRSSAILRPGCPIPTRAANYGTFAWWIPTIAARSTTKRGARCWPSSKEAWTSTRSCAKWTAACRSFGLPIRRCTCARASGVVRRGGSLHSSLCGGGKEGTYRCLSARRARGYSCSAMERQAGRRAQRVPGCDHA